MPIRTLCGPRRTIVITMSGPMLICSPTFLLSTSMIHPCCCDCCVCVREHHTLFRLIYPRSNGMTT